MTRTALMARAAHMIREAPAIDPLDPTKAISWFTQSPLFIFQSLAESFNKAATFYSEQHISKCLEAYGKFFQFLASATGARSGPLGITLKQFFTQLSEEYEYEGCVRGLGEIFGLIVI